MKQKLSNFLFGLLCIAGQIVHAQDNGCNMSWSNPARAIYNSEGAIYYVVQFSKCSSSSICGWPKITLEHTFPFPVSISLTLSGIQCDGTAIKGDYSTASNEISANSRYINQGNWHTFKSVTEVVRVEVSYHKGSDFYKIVYDKEKGINETYINNKTIAEYNASKQQSSASGSSSSNSTNNKTQLPTTTTTKNSSVTTANNPSSHSYDTAPVNANQSIKENYQRQLKENQTIYENSVNTLDQIGNVVAKTLADKKALQDERLREQKEEREKEIQKELEYQYSINEIKRKMYEESENTVSEILSSIYYTEDTYKTNKWLKDEVSSSKAINLFRAQAQKDNYLAMHNLFVYYYNGIATKKDLFEAKKWLLSSILNKNNTDLIFSQYQIMIYDRLMLNDKLPPINSLTGRSDWYYTMPVIYMPVREVHAKPVYTEKDLKKIFKEKEKLSNKGDVSAQYNLALMYTKGDAMPSNIAKAIELLKGASNNGSINALLYMGFLYYTGDEQCPIDIGKAIMYWNMALKQESQIDKEKLKCIKALIGEQYLTGIYINKDYDQGIKYSIEGACNGFYPQQKTLSTLFLTRDNTNSVNLLEAKRWSIESELNSQKDETAITKLRNIYIEENNWYTFHSENDMKRREKELRQRYRNGSL